MHAVVDVVQDRLEAGVVHALPQDVERLHEGQPRPEQRRELLVEDQELPGPDAPARRRRKARPGERAAAAEREHVEPLRLQLLPEGRLALGDVHALDDLAGLGAEPAVELHAVRRRTPPRTHCARPAAAQPVERDSSSPGPAAHASAPAGFAGAAGRRSPPPRSARTAGRLPLDDVAPCAAGGLERRRRELRAWLPHVSPHVRVAAIFAPAAHLPSCGGAPLMQSSSSHDERWAAPACHADSESSGGPRRCLSKPSAWSKPRVSSAR